MAAAATLLPRPGPSRSRFTAHRHPCQSLCRSFDPTPTSRKKTEDFAQLPVHPPIRSFVSGHGFCSGPQFFPGTRQVCSAIPDPKWNTFAECSLSNASLRPKKNHLIFLPRLASCSVLDESSPTSRTTTPFHRVDHVLGGLLTRRWWYANLPPATSPVQSATTCSPVRSFLRRRSECLE